MIMKMTVLDKENNTGPMIDDYLSCFGQTVQKRNGKVFSHVY